MRFTSRYWRQSAWKALLLSASITFAGPGFAADNGISLPLNFGAGEPNGADEGIVDGAAGVAATRNWNNLFGNENFDGDELFLDVAGSEVASDVTVEWTSNNTWSSDGRGGEDTNDAPEATDRALMLGYLDTSDVSVTEISIAGIPEDLATGGYDVFVYALNGVLNRGGEYSVSDGTKSDTATNITRRAFDGTYVEGEEGNYLLFEGFTGTSLTIEAMALPADEGENFLGFRAPINAVEICAAGACTALPNQVAGRGVIGNQSISGDRSNAVFGPPQDEGPGLLQEWFAVANPGSKEGVDQVVNENEPLVEPFRSESTWWSGTDVPFGEMQNYPEEIDPPREDEYTVRLTGEILIEESGTYRFADGIDDFAYLAIDVDGSGTAGDSADEVLINDNQWTNALRSENNGGGGLAEVDITVPDGGSWLAVEVNAAEGGGGDSGVIYWDYNPDAPDGSKIGGGEGFPDVSEDPIFEEDAELLVIPESHLRGALTPLISADLSGVLPESPTGWQFEIDGDNDTADAFVVANPNDAVFTTTLDVDGAEFFISVTGDVEAGDSFRIIDADQISGTPSVFPADWTFDANTGFITFGSGIPCDFDGSGSLDVGDIDAVRNAILAGANEARFDVNNDSVVDSSDIVALVEGADKLNSYVGDANLDGEFNSSDFVTVFTQGQYEDGEALNSTWATGDWNGDGDFTSTDFVFAFTSGGYELGPRAGVAAVPEPSGIVLFVLGGLGLIRRRK